MLKGKRILLISPEPWDHIFVSKHHYARHLALRGNNVYFLNPPSLRRGVNVEKTDYDGVFSIVYGGFLGGLRFLPKLLRKTIARNKFREIRAAIGQDIDIVWSFDNSVFFDLDVLPSSINISHIVDKNQDFQFQRAAKSAAICLSCSRYIVSKQLGINPNSFFINHGYNQQKSNEGCAPYPGQGSLKALYVGNLAMPYLDWDILLEASEKFRETDFVFIGPGAEAIDTAINPTHRSKVRCMAQPNVHTLGRISHDSITSHLKQADILLLAYQEKHHVDQANPHKMMEYLGSGTPIVATFTGEFEDHRDIIAMSSSNNEWASNLGSVIKNLRSWAKPELSKKRQALALENTYNKQIDRIEGLLEQNVRVEHQR